MLPIQTREDIIAFQRKFENTKFRPVQDAETRNLALAEINTIADYLEWQGNQRLAQVLRQCAVILE